MLLPSKVFELKKVLLEQHMRELVKVLNIVML